MKSVVVALLLIGAALADFTAIDLLVNPAPLSCDTTHCEADATAANCAGRNAFAAYDDSCGGSGGHAMFTEFSAAFPQGFGVDRWSFSVVNGASTGRFETYGNNVGDKARLYGELIANNGDNTNSWDIIVELQKIQRQGSSYKVKNELNQGCQLANVNNLANTWDFYLLRTDKPSLLVGKGRWAGLNITLGLERSVSYPFLVGEGGSQKNIGWGVSTWVAYNGFTYDDNVWKGAHLDFRLDPSVRMKEGDLDINIECPCQCNPPHTSVCGNNIVETGEDCDGGACCTKTCTFAPSSQTCRVANGECDVSETCTGTSSDCPADSYSPISQPCQETVGFCDVRIHNTCPGDAPVCHGPPSLPLDQGLYPFENFNVISFLDYIGTNGDVEGRLAVGRNLVIENFSVGLKTNSTQGGGDNQLPYAVVVGHNATWTTGSIYPDGSGNPTTSVEEGIFVGDTFTAPDYLFMRLGSVSVVIGDKDVYFQAGQQYFSELQLKFSAGVDNVAVTTQYNGLFLKCNNFTADFYYVSITGAQLSQTTWYSLENCNILASYVINVKGSDSVLLQGDRFPTVIERVVYNIEGSDRYINVTTGIGGNILAPNNILYQTNGVTRGLVVVGDVKATVQNNKPNCINFDPIVIVGKTNGDIVNPGAAPKRSVYEVQADGQFSYLPVATYGSFSVSDVLVINGQTTTVAGGAQQNNQLYIVVSPQVSAAGSGASFTVTIANPSTITGRTQLQNDHEVVVDQSPATTTVAAFGLIAACALLAAL